MYTFTVKRKHNSKTTDKVGFEVLTAVVMDGTL
jgi:hypothetical protein